MDELHSAVEILRIRRPCGVEQEVDKDRCSRTCALKYSSVLLLLFSPAACSCHPVGSVPPCDPTGGRCTCKPGVGGARCDSCMLGYWGLHRYGCRPCDCGGGCDPFTGDCPSG